MNAITTMVKVYISLAFFALVSCSHQSEQQIPLLKIHKKTIEFTVLAQGELEALKSTPISSTSKARKPQTIAWIAPQFSYVKKGDVIVKFDAVPFAMESKEVAFEMAKIQMQKGQKQRQLDLSLYDFQNQEKVVSFEYDMAKKFNIDNPLLYTKIEMIDASDNEEFLQAKSQHLKRMAEHFKDKAKSEISLITSKEKLQQNKLAINQENLNSLEIKAPHDGLFVLQKSWDGSLPQAGKVIFMGMKLGKLPDLSQMQAKIYLPEIEAVGIKQGQRVNIKLHAFPRMDFTAKITNISKTAQPKQRDNPIKYFTLNAVLEQKDQQHLLPGQRLDATIILLHEEQAISVPIQAIFRENNHSWVFQKNGATFSKKTVTLGVCSSSECIIRSGLEENTSIALINPTLNNREKKKP